MAVFNFSPGPGVLPEPVKKQVMAEWYDFAGTGSSVCELSHRGPAFATVVDESEADLRTLLDIPEHYVVLFLQGGATQQFSTIPWNLGGPAGYVINGHWGAKAQRLAAREIDARIIADSGPAYRTAPPPTDWQITDDLRYVHVTPNETIHGVRLPHVPSGLPLVADMSSALLSETIDVKDYALIYASAQKNIGPAGITLIIADPARLDASESIPHFADYAAIAQARSLHNTPPTFAWYVSGLVFKWLLDQGGVGAIERRNRARARRLYAAIDESGFYQNAVAPASRSFMNVPFQLADAELDQRFLTHAAQAGLHALKGHRAVGGMRASLYNALPDSAVDALIDFMQEFERTHG